MAQAVNGGAFYFDSVEVSLAERTSPPARERQTGGTTLALLCGGEQGGWAFARAVVP